MLSVTIVTMAISVSISHLSRRIYCIVIDRMIFMLDRQLSELANNY